MSSIMAYVDNPIRNVEFTGRSVHCRHFCAFEFSDEIEGPCTEMTMKTITSICKLSNIVLEYKKLFCSITRKKTPIQSTSYEANFFKVLSNFS